MTASPGVTRGGSTYPDLRATAATYSEGRQDAAIIVAIEDYATLADRPNAQAVAAAWYRYLRETRRIRPARIILLRDAGATREAVTAALERTHNAVGRRGTVWFVFVGHVSGTLPGKYGALWLQGGDGTPATLKQQAVPAALVLSRLGHGLHPRAIAVFDGCLTGGPQSLSPGTETPELPPWIDRGAIDDIPVIPEELLRGPSSLGTELLIAQIKTQIDFARGRREPADVAVFSSGHGPGCVEDLPGTRFPALSYLLLGGLRGWADRDRDGKVGALELITQVTEMLRAAHHGVQGPAPAPNSYSADIVLARGVTERAPDIRGLLPPDIARTFKVATLLAQPVLWSRDALVRFERGRFRMGCPWRGDTDCEKDERPAHLVWVSRFQLDPLEVTRAEYAACVAGGTCDAVDPTTCFVWTGQRFVKGAPIPEPLLRPRHPMVCVSWFQAGRYCAAHGKRLVTEAEWERAAAGTTRRRFPWGDSTPTCSRAHFDSCGEHTRPVGERPAGATPEGVHDLAGNAAEWVHDWYDRDIYKDLRGRDPVGPQSGVVRVVRGGSYYDAPETLRSSYRYGLNPTSSFSTVGFRCAR